MSDSSDSSSIDSLFENDCDSEPDSFNLKNESELETDFLSSFINLSLNNTNTKMPAPPAFDVKNLNVIPDFDGNPNKLHRFIQASEAILLHYFDLENTNNFQNTLLLNGILNKLHGRAEEIVAIHGATNSWDNIKNALLLNFGDQRDENCLNQDLVNLRQNFNETPQEFHEKIITILNTICNYIDLKCEAALRPSKREFFTKQALKTFLAGLREPLGPIIRAMRPDSLAQALQFIIEEDNIKHYQKSNAISNRRNTSFQNISKNNYNHSMKFQNNNQNYGFSNQQPTTSQFPSVPINLQRNPNYKEPKFFTNSQVFGRPQPQLQKPTPMSISTNFSQKPTPMSISTNNTNPKLKSKNMNRNFYPRNNSRPNFVSEELFNTEYCEEESPQDFPENFEEYSQEYNFDENEENFQIDSAQDPNT